MQAAVHQNHQNPSDSSLFPPGLTAPQVRVASALAQGSTVTAAAAECGIHRTTIHHWMRTSLLFRKAVDEASREFRLSLQDSLAQLSTQALQTLEKLMSDPDAPHAVRLRAALAVLERPRFPRGTWSLPDDVESTREREVTEAIEQLGAPTDTYASPATPRNAPCPCGSGDKYKRCCGRGAVPVLGRRPPLSNDRPPGAPGPPVI